MQIKTENLTYIYSEKSKSLAVKALDNVSLTVNSGDFFGIVGKTGSGKSTFVQHINGLIKTERGTMLVGEYNLSDKKCNLKELRSKVGMVFQYPEYQLFAETVFEDVGFALKNFFPDMQEKEREEKIKEALSLVGLDYESVKDRSPFEFSGGQKRRIAIAGVVVSKPEVLILDEPVAGLDPSGKKDFMRLLQTLHRQFVKTIVIVSHDMNIVAEYCNRVAVFDNAKLVKAGTTKEIFTDYDLIEKCSLSLPITAYLEKEMKSSGIEIDSDLTLEGFVSALKNKVRGEV